MNMLDKQVIIIRIFTKVLLPVGGHRWPHGLLKQDLSFCVHLLKSVEHVGADLLLRLNKLLHGLDILRVGVDGGADVQAGAVVETGHMVGEVGLGGEEGVVQDLVGLVNHLDQIQVDLLTPVCQAAKLFHVFPDLLFAEILL